MKEIDVSSLPIKHHFGGGIYIKETHLKAGEMGEKHKQNVEHLSYLVSGKVKLVIDGDVTRTMVGPEALTVQADKIHQVHALTDVVWLCCHATDCTDPAQIDNVIIEGSHV